MANKLYSTPILKQKSIMYKNLIELLLIFTLFSCVNNEKTKVLVSNETQIDTAKNEILFSEFDWSKIKDLKQNTISLLLNDDLAKDSILIDFIEKYAALEDEYTDVLYSVEYFDTLNTLAYSSKDNVFPKAIEFEKNVEKNGFKLKQTEGMIEFLGTSKYIKDDIFALLDDTSKLFLNLYCSDLDNLCCDDAILVISERELINRVYMWGELTKQVKGLQFENYTESKFSGYISLIFAGIDNAPAFDWGTKKFRPERLELMRELIKKYPSSRASLEFIEYIELLEQEDFRETEAIKKYLDDKQ